MKSLYLLLLYLVFSAIAIGAYDMLPMRQLTLIASGAPQNQNTSIFTDQTGDTEAFWINDKRVHFTCVYNPSETTQSRYCGLDIVLGNGENSGIDLSIYDAIILRMHYTGEAKVLRFYIRHAMKKLPHRLKPENTLKYNNVFIPSSELDAQLTIKLSELSVAEWWLRSAPLPMAYSYPDFSNAINLGIDVPYPAPAGKHEFDITNLTLSGRYISRENWYLCVMAFWFVVLLIRSLRHYLTLKKQAQKSSHMLEEALGKTQSLEMESLRYKELSLTDPLTGVFNRRGIKQLSEHLLVSRNPQKFECCVVLVDVDHFKKINDTFGHNAGDQVLKEIAAALKNGTRSLDKIGRWGGEEFLIICPNTTLEQALRLTEHIRQDINRIGLAGSGIKISASFGIARVQNQNFENAIHNADEALYKAKRTGRNRTCVYSLSTADIVPS